MLEKIKRNLAYTISAILGLLNFIFLAIPYIASFYSYNLGGWGGTQSSSVGISGYHVMSMWGGGFPGVMSSLLQILVLILGILLLAWGTMGLLAAFGILRQFPDKLGNFESKKIAEYGLFGIAGLNVLLLVFLIIFAATNTQTYNDYGYSTSAGIQLSAGIFISLVFTVGAVVALKVLEKKLPMSDSDEIVTYVCVKCGKKAKASDKFCNVCGGEIERRVVVKEEYACVKCGKKASAKEKFCNACGGEIKVKATPPMEGAASTADDITAQG